MSIEDREWYQEKQRQNDRKKFGSSYQNSYGWYYKLRGQEFGPCDKDNIMRLIREHTLSSDSLVKQGKQSQWIPIRNLPREFPADGRTIQQSAAHQQRKTKRQLNSIWVIFICMLVLLILYCFAKYV